MGWIWAGWYKSNQTHELAHQTYDSVLISHDNIATTLKEAENLRNKCLLLLSLSLILLGLKSNSILKRKERSGTSPLLTVFRDAKPIPTLSLSLFDLKQNQDIEYRNLTLST